jgi:hypothetical protein
MPEIGMSVSMSGDGKRGVGHRPQATAPILDSTITGMAGARRSGSAVRGTPAAAATSGGCGADFGGFARGRKWICNAQRRE